MPLEVKTKTITIVPIDDSEVVEFVNNNPERAGMLFINGGPNTVYLGVDDTVTAQTGLFLPIGQRWDEFNFNTGAWFGICAENESANILVLEII